MGKNIMLNKQQPFETKKRINAIRGFSTHLIVYIFVLLMMVILGIGTTGNVPLILLVAVGWGVGVALHGVNTLIRDPIE